LVPIPKRSTSPPGDIDTVVMDSLKALDLERPIREADIFAVPVVKKIRRRRTLNLGRPARSQRQRLLHLLATAIEWRDQ
jgi:hypothetical protein